MPGPTPHRTPLRRVSQGSLFALSRSGAHTDAPHGLGFLEPALAELADEAEALRANVEGLRALSASLDTFNEAFASWLYVMNMNALTVEWPEAPTEASYILAKRREEEDARAALSAATQQAHALASAKLDEAMNTTGLIDTATFADASLAPETSKSAVAKVKKKGKPRLTPKEKKERSMAIDKVILSLPLEFRGKDPTMRRNMEMVVEHLMCSDGRGLKLIEMIVPPDLNQARVNKCLIALVNRKIVTKDNSSGTVLYHWQGAAT
ncbi:DASH complex subunit Dam1-domain-containing protein [Russula ochroleuca]|jgi:DASH complex subunit DAM1|uniref:DASH complex subunit DAM1 n=1 Tax=Russula ochroleuca TaxID=152965 RepID=A0A9P5MVP6_9AGAM|nr:DASH complex subunit Dam1-domain-containing protein [Russula ochroleuca]